MILRRISQHVKDQNWFAVGLDFVIVVIGVLLAIQVANWNEVRQERAEETRIVDRIRVDFDRIEDDAQRSLMYHESIASDLKAMVRALRAGELPESDVPAFERALFLGQAFQTSADHSGTFTELLSSGRANLLSDKELLNELVAYEDFLERFAVAQQYFVDMAFGVQAPFSAAFQYDIGAPFFSDLLQLDAESPAIGAYDFNAMASDEEFMNAAEQLVFVHSLYTMWRTRIRDRITAIQHQLGETAP
ncbi:MAG: hypothetical protein GC152_04265 [Alphaproteobacteria bacterium]|nr:hypothetical protein [Alphaproteobacteria bacterium]